MGLTYSDDLDNKLTLLGHITDGKFRTDIFIGDLYYMFWKKEEYFSKLLELANNLSVTLSRSSQGPFWSKESRLLRRLKKISGLILKGKKIEQEIKEKDKLGFFGKIFLNIKKNENMDTPYHLQKEIVKTHALCLEIIKEFRGQSVYNIPMLCPYLRVETNEDLDQLRKMSEENVFGTKLFSILHKYVFCYFPNRFVSIEILEELLDTLKNEKEYTIYFNNVRKFRTMFPFYPTKGYSIITNHQGFRKDDVFIFMDDEFIKICELWMGIFGQHALTKEYADSYFRGQFDFTHESYNAVVNSLIEIRDFLRTNVKNEIRKNYGVGLTLIASSPIHLEPRILKLTREHIELFVKLERSLIEFLILSGIKKIHNGEELKMVEYINALLKENALFGENKKTIATLFLQCVDEGLKDVFHLHKFLKLCSLVGKEIFEDVFKKNGKLSSANLQFLEEKALLGESVALKKVVQDVVNFSSDRKKKTVLILASADDWNLSNKRVYEDFKLLPQDKFSVYFHYVGSIGHFASIIKTIGKNSPIDVLIFHAHGNAKVILLGEKENGLITKNTINKFRLNELSKYFTTRSVCYLISCSVGKGANSIAQELKNALQIKVIAPTENISGNKINVQGKDISVDFEGSFGTEEKLQIREFN